MFSSITHHDRCTITVAALTYSYSSLPTFLALFSLLKRHNKVWGPAQTPNGIQIALQIYLVHTLKLHQVIQQGYTLHSLILNEEGESDLGVK